TRRVAVTCFSAIAVRVEATVSVFKSINLNLTTETRRHGGKPKEVGEERNGLGFEAHSWGLGRSLLCSKRSSLTAKSCRCSSPCLRASVVKSSLNDFWNFEEILVFYRRIRQRFRVRQRWAQLIFTPCGGRIFYALCDGR